LDRNSNKKNLQHLPQIPNKLYFSIGEVSDLCLVKPYVLRYWEQEFPQLNPTKRRGKRRYYQRNEIILIRHIKSLLYEQGFTIAGARNKLNDEKPSSKQLTPFIKNTISQLKKILTELE
jgi:DNA-binding transcriptional MerR regulator